MYWPNPAVTPTHIHTWTRFFPSTFTLRGINGTSTMASQSWATSNLARIMPMYLPFPYMVRRVFWINGSGTLGNMCLGIYSKDFQRLYTTGSVAQSGASSLQFSSVGLTTPLYLAPGHYFLAINNDGTTNRGYGSSASNENVRFAGCYQMASAFPLPTSLTPAAPSQAGYFFCGITRLSAD